MSAHCQTFTNSDLPFWVWLWEREPEGAEMQKWCVEHFGPGSEYRFDGNPGVRWAYDRIGVLTFHFRDEDDALFFKLRFG